MGSTVCFALQYVAVENEFEKAGLWSVMNLQFSPRRYILLDFTTCTFTFASISVIY